MEKDIREQALEYHRQSPAGKIKVVATKHLMTKKDLALAYTPGVAAACEEVVRDPIEVASMTSRGNLVAVVTNGTAVLGLGAIGPLAAKPVMEGKAVLFKKFAGVDVFDIEVDELDPEKLVDVIAALEPTFGGINLEDIKAPECFYVEEQLRKRLNIPVFHDDQHGTAIICSAAVVNGLHLVGKDIGDVKLVTSGAGAAGIACLDLLVSLGLHQDNILVTDRNGVVYVGRDDDMDSRKAGYAAKTDARTLADAIAGADIFLGVSAPGVLTQEMVATMAERPIVLALANPVPEIMPEEVLAVRDDAIIATGRSDYPNQVNNVLCFPYIFRGALDCGATTINEEMKMACVHAIAELARKEVSDVVARAYGDAELQFGPEHIIPNPFDPRLPEFLAPAVAQAAMDSGVATRPIENMESYREKMTQFVFRTGLMVKPIFRKAKADPKRIVFAEGEEEVVLRAVQTIVDEGLAAPILIGRPRVVAERIQRLGLRLDPTRDFELVNPDDDPRYYDYWKLYHQIMKRRGVSPDIAKAVVRTRGTAIAALMVKRREADGVVCGVVGRFHSKLGYLSNVLGLQPGVETPSALSAVALENRVVFFCDTHANSCPNAQHIAETAVMAAERVRNFGIEPKIALLSHSNFGSHADASAQKMRDVYALLQANAPELAVEGEMSGDAALLPNIRERLFPESGFEDAANLFIMPDMDSAQIAFHLVCVLADGVSVGPMLMGTRQPAHVLTPSTTARGIVNVTALCVVEAQQYAAQHGAPNAAPKRTAE